MGVTAVYSTFNWLYGDVRSPQNAAECIQRTLEEHALEKCGKYRVECNVIQANSPSVEKNILLTTHSIYPQQSFVFTDRSTVVTAQGPLISMFRLLKNNYTAKPGLKSEVTGHCYTCGDFSIRVGVTKIGEQLRGVLLEVEYEPCYTTAQGVPIIREFLCGLFGTEPRSEPSSLQEEMKKNPSELFQPSLIAVQYFEQFEVLRTAKG